MSAASPLPHPPVGLASSGVHHSEHPQPLAAARARCAALTLNEASQALLWQDQQAAQVGAVGSLQGAGQQALMYGTGDSRHACHGLACASVAHVQSDSASCWFRYAFRSPRQVVCVFALVHTTQDVPGGWCMHNHISIKQTTSVQQSHKATRQRHESSGSHSR